MDINDNLYCFGSNEYNKLALDTHKNEQIIWKPIKNSYFDKSVTEKYVNTISCGWNTVCFIDNNYQLYWSGKYKLGQDTSSSSSCLYHWQSSKENVGYENVKIKLIECNDDENDFLLIMIDTMNRIKPIASGSGYIQSNIPYLEIPQLNKSHNVEKIQFLESSVLIISSQKH